MKRTAAVCRDVARTKFAHWLRALVIGLTATLPVHAQLTPGTAPPRRYVQFEIDQDAHKKLQNRLQMESQLEPFKDLVKQIAADPSKFPIDPKMLKEAKIDDQKKKAIEDWLNNDRDLQEKLRKWVDQNQGGKDPKKAEFQKDLQKILAGAEQKQPPVDPRRPPPGHEGSEPGKDDGDTLGKMTERAMKQAESTKFGDWLRDSPAWNRAFSDLRSQMDDPNAKHGKAWQDKLRLLDGMGWKKLGENTLEQLKEMPRPELGNLKGTLPKNVTPPNLGVPGVPDFSGPTLPTVSTGMTWLLLIVLFLLVSWQMLRWNRRRAQAAEVLARLGPWPVHPEAVATRAELIRAYDYLALLTLGLNVQSWNHHAVARRWSEQAPPCTDAALALALLYEQARYTNGAEVLDDTQRDLARGALNQLKEAL